MSGRDFAEQDRLGSAKVTIINEKMARYFFGDENPVGKRIGLDEIPDTTIVGVVKDAKYINLRQGMRRHFYTPTRQEARPSSLTLHVKVAGDPTAMVTLLTGEIKSLDPVQAGAVAGVGGHRRWSWGQRWRSHGLLNQCCLE